MKPPASWPVPESLRPRAIIVAIHGILTRTTRTAWTDEFGAYLINRPERVWFEKKEYFAGPISLWNVFVRNRMHARELSDSLRLLLEHHPSPLHFVSHSNGTDIALRTIHNLSRHGIGTESAIFTGSVLNPDVQANGIADLVMDGRLRRAVAYVSSSDVPLKVAPIAWPYSNLGRRGWTLNGEPYEVPGVIVTRRFPNYGHSGYFAPEHRESTFSVMCEDMGLRTDRENLQSSNR